MGTTPHPPLSTRSNPDLVPEDEDTDGPQDDDVPDELLTITLVRARNLLAMDTRSILSTRATTSDPVVIASLGRNSHRSRCAHTCVRRHTC